MTAAAWPSHAYEEDRRLPIPSGPAEGWLTIGLVFLLVLPVAWSIQDARWVLGEGRLTEFLPWTVMGGAAVGMLGAKAGWGRWRSHLLGAVAAALAVPILVGAVIEPSGGITDWFVVTAERTVEAALDLSIRNKTVTQQYGHFLLVLGLVCWATGQFAGYATLGHRRPLGAVFVTGLVLLANMTVTVRDQLQYLVIFSLAALLVLVRLHADDERLGWLRRRIGDPATVTGLYLRGGSGFVVAAVIGSLFLTSVAASAPLAGAFRTLDQRLVEVGQSIQRFLPFGGPGTRIHGDSFGGTASITGQWQTDNTPSLEIQVPVGDTKSYYWRAFVYDRFTLNGWTLGENAREDRSTGQSILEGTGDQVPDPSVRHPLSYLVRSVGYSGSAIFLPDAPGTVDMSSQLTLVGDQRAFGGLEASGSWQTYRATSLVPTEGGEAFTVSQLRAAGTQYPEEFDFERYTDVAQGAIGPEAQKLLARIQQLANASGDAENAYDLAHEAEKLLRGSDFVYDTNVTDLPCEGLSAVECFAKYKHGYCQYYASTMAILLRQAGIPTRVAEGYMPGDRDDRTGIETILRSNAHAWVEVYFPRFGWYRFDPTGGGLTNLLPLPTGRPVPTASPGDPLGSAGGPAASPRGNRPLNETDPGAGTTTPPGSGSAPFVIVGLLLLLSVAGIAFLIYWRGPRRASPPDAVWSSLGRLAGRFGWAPTPTQTPFEYAQALGDVLPVARPELHVVANAKVEAAYGRHVLDERRIAALREAYRRLRLQLLRLAFRRPDRPGRVRPGGFWRPRRRR
jgi:transglutaminase-like putative cysteine protease